MAERPVLTVVTDPTNLAEKLDGVTLTNALKPFIKAAAKISADHIADEAAGRLSRQLSGTSSGRTVAGIVVRSAGAGWAVKSGNATMPMLPRWLERGTIHMKARTYFDNSATLELPAHERRIEAAIEAGLSEYGLGDSR